MVDKRPQFPNGKKALFDFIEKELMYPKKAKENGREGTVVVGFIVNEEGKIKEPEIKNSSNSKLLDQEALRIIRNMPDWKPGIKKGKKVSVRLKFPIRFSFDDDEEDPEEGG